MSIWGTVFSIEVNGFLSSSKRNPAARNVDQPVKTNLDHSKANRSLTTPAQADWHSLFPRLL